MRMIRALLVSLSLLGTVRASAQMTMESEKSRAVKGGGITASGWMGQVDASEAKAGMTISDAKFAAMGGGFHVTTGPSATYWNPSYAMSGNFTVKATFTEPQYMSLNDHPHPYGIVIGGHALGTDKATLLYCTAYGNGTYIVRGFGPAPFRLGGRGATPHEAVHKASGKGGSVTQDIAVTVQDGTVSCAINGVVVATFDQRETVGEGKLQSLDGLVGVRVGHNAEVMISGFQAKQR